MILELRNPDYHDGGAHRRRDQRLFAAKRFRKPSPSSGTPRSVILPAAGASATRFHGADRRIAGRARHGGARRDRCAHRHRGDRPGRADFDGRGDAWHAHVRVSETRRPRSRALSNGKTVVTPQTQIDVEQAGGQVAVVKRHRACAPGRRPQRLGVKPSGIIAICRRSRPPARCRPTSSSSSVGPAKA